MIRKNLSDNVYEATQKRLKFIFEEFENIYISFSGGKDSGLLLQLLLDFRDKYYPQKKIGVFHQDFEAQYSVTTDYVEEVFSSLTDNKVEKYWVCLPMATRTALSSYEMYWYPWDDKKEDSWVRPMPEHDYVINLNNNIFTNYYYKMHQEDLAKQFGRWYRQIHQNRKTICLLGIRADESLQRYSGFVNKKYGYKNKCWITHNFKGVWAASPLYDWTVDDIWHAYYKFGYTYNNLYNLFYKAGLSASQMRVASPFQDCAKESLNLYRVIDPAIWVKLVGRVQGANFASIYGRSKAMGYRTITLPEGHTWKSYTQFLLSTLPTELRNNYIKKFNKSITFWHHVGGGLEEKTIEELLQNGYRIKRNGISNYTIFKNSRIIFLQNIPDDTDDIKSTKDIPSWKRMCFCILKNDHICRFMGFGLTRMQQRKLDFIKSKYKCIDGS
ncbi:phosphoadenosine phosphosulfate reductase [Enterococcus sp. MSG3287]|uniref:phosphoadenosine phosphosulfate reductase n=1 Tax=Enterococcus sp. MSG3287 TaxID=2775002 RepID=UPI003F23EB75